MFIRIVLGIALPLSAGVFFLLRHTVKASPVFPAKKRKTLSWLLPFLGLSLFFALFVSFGWLVAYLHFLLLLALTEFLSFLAAKAVKRPLPRLRRAVFSGLPAFMLTLAIMLYAYVNMCSVRETHYSVTSEKPLDRPYTLILVTDMHYGNSINKERLTALTERLSALHADALLLGGDIIDGNTDADGAAEAFRLLGGVKTAYGTYYVSGNHDRGLYRGDTAHSLAEALEESGVTLLEDETAPLGGLLLLGRRDFSDRKRAPVEALLPAVREQCVVVLDHQPREYAESVSAGVTLQLSGHTHAGQMFPAGFLTEAAGSELNYGRRNDGAFTGIVSSGVSGWGFPLRTSRHSEYVTVTITPDPPEY